MNQKTKDLKKLKELMERFELVLTGHQQQGLYDGEELQPIFTKIDKVKKEIEANLHH